jgi:hypothetical protein
MTERIAELISFYRCRAGEQKMALTHWPIEKKPLTSRGNVRGGSVKS